MTSKIIRLDVGGSIFRTTVSTLTSIEGSYFDAMFRTDAWAESTVNRDKDENSIFIDRGISFCYFIFFP